MDKEISKIQNQAVTEEAMNQHNELSEKELESVAGGSGNGGKNPIQKFLQDAGNIEIFEDETATQEGQGSEDTGEVLREVNPANRDNVQGSAQNQQTATQNAINQAEQGEENKENIPPQNQQNQQN